MPHVVHLTTVHLPFDTRIFHKECRSLSNAGYRVTLITNHTRRESVDGVEFIPLPKFRNRIDRMLIGPWTVYRLARHLKADLYHFHDPELMPVGIALKITSRAKVVYDVHENFPKNMLAKTWMAAPMRRIASWVVKLSEMITSIFIDGVVTVTEFIAARFPKDKTVVLRNLPPLIENLDNIPDRKYEGNYQVIYTGGLTAHRGITEIVLALPLVKTPETKLLLLGRVIDRTVWEVVQELPGFTKVDYIGQVPFDQMYDYLHQAAVGMLCNQPRYGYDQALPNKLFEYMYSGLPIIASDFELWREIITENDCGRLVDPTKPQEIAKSIDDLLNNPDERRKMGENARKAVLEKYNWEKEQQKLLDLYQELLRV
jgi:glycosyltransferase involved in cell wall biosynthesis